MNLTRNKILNKYKMLPAPVKASLWYTICNIINKGVALLTTPIFTRVMTEEQYGQFAIFQSWVSIFIIFTSLNIFLGGYQKGLLLFENDVARFTSSQLGLIITITSAFLAIYLCAPNYWSSLFELSPILMIAMFAELYLMPATELWSAKQRFDYQYKKYVLLTIFMSIFSVAVGVITVINTPYKTEARIYSDMLAKSIGGILLLIILFKRGRQFYSKQYWKYALAFNLPLIPHYLSHFVLNQSDRLMIGKMVGNAQAAYYSVAYSISSMMLLITTAINNSLTPYIYKSIKSKNTHSISKIANALVLLVAGLCICVTAFAPEVIYIFAGIAYLDAIYVIPPISLSIFFIFIYSLFSTIEYYFMKTKWISIATFICAVVNLTLNYVFIKIFGYYAAGYTTLVSYMLLSCMHFTFYKRVLKEKSISENIFNIKFILIVSISMLLLMLFFTLVYRYIAIRYLLVTIILCIALIKRKEMQSLLSTLKK